MFIGEGNVNKKLSLTLFVSTTEKNGLSGVLTHELGALLSLAVMNVFQNDLMGTIPAVAWPNLQILDVEENMLSGQVYVDLMSSALLSYRVSFNFLTGTVPAVLDAPELRELWIAGNAVTGTIPDTIGNLRMLGTFPFILWRKSAASWGLCSLTFQQLFFLTESINAYENNLVGTLPSQLGLLDLTNFQAHGNRLTGTIPEEFWQNSNLKDLRLEDNRLTGSLSTSIGQLIDMTALRLGENELTGLLPAQLTSLTNLGTPIDAWRPVPFPISFVH